MTTNKDTDQLDDATDRRIAEFEARLVKQIDDLKSDLKEKIETTAEAHEKNTKIHVDYLIENFNQKFKIVDQKFEATDRRFESIDHLFDHVNQRIDDVKSELIVKIDSTADAQEKTNQANFNTLVTAIESLKANYRAHVTGLYDLLTILISVLGIGITIYSLTSSNRNASVGASSYQVSSDQPANVCVSYRIFDDGSGLCQRWQEVEVVNLKDRTEKSSK